MHNVRSDVEDFPRLLRMLGNMIQAVSDAAPSGHSEWLLDAHHFAYKAYRHMESIEALLKGVIWYEKERPVRRYVDHASIAVICRAVYELNALFHFIFKAPSSEERLFRYRVWCLASTRARHKWLSLVREFHTERADWAAREKEFLADLKQKVVDDPLYNQLQEWRQKKIDQDDEKLGYKWPELIAMAGSSKQQATVMYRHLCSYAHTAPDSLKRISRAAYESKDNEMAKFSVSICTFVNSQLILAYADLFPTAANELYEAPQMLATAQFWVNIARQL